MRRLLINLYNRIGIALMRSEVKRAKRNFKYPAGPFYGRQQESVNYMTSVMYDEEDDVEYRVKYICSCDEYVYELGVEGSFACVHCDSACNQKNCSVCYDLNARDLWSDANL